MGVFGFQCSVFSGPTMRREKLSMSHELHQDGSSLDSATPSDGCEAQLAARRAVIFSWCATFAAITFGSWAIATRHIHHGGADDPEFILLDLFSLAAVVAFVAGVFGVLRGFRCRAMKSVILASLPMLFIGGLWAWLAWVANHR
jgi:hypothetical protein